MRAISFERHGRPDARPPALRSCSSIPTQPARSPALSAELTELAQIFPRQRAPAAQRAHAGALQGIQVFPRFADDVGQRPVARPAQAHAHQHLGQIDRLEPGPGKQPQDAIVVGSDATEYGFTRGANYYGGYDYDK